MVHPLECEDTLYMGEATDRRQPLHYRVSPLRASQWCTLEGEDTFDMSEATDRRQPLHYRVSPLRASQWCTLEGEDTFDMGEATDRRQPLHYRVSPLRASQWCTLLNVKIHLIWVTLMIAVNRYTIVCLLLREGCSIQINVYNLPVVVIFRCSQVRLNNVF